MGVHSGYNSFLLKQKENSGSVTATFRDKMKGPASNDKHKIALGHFLAMRDADTSNVFKGFIVASEGSNTCFGGVSRVSKLK